MKIFTEKSLLKEVILSNEFIGLEIRLNSCFVSGIIILGGYKVCYNIIFVTTIPAAVIIVV
jgi:hypothetical protein